MPYIKHRNVIINTYHDICNMYPQRKCISVDTKHLHLMVGHSGIHRFNLIKLNIFYHGDKAFSISIYVHNENLCFNIMRLSHVICLICNSQKTLKSCVISGAIFNEVHLKKISPMNAVIMRLSQYKNDVLWVWMFPLWKYDSFAAVLYL